MTDRTVPDSDGIAPPNDASRYDAYLLALPTLLFGCALLALLADAPLAYGTGVGGVLAALVLGHGLFRDPPNEGRGGARAGAATAADD